MKVPFRPGEIRFCHDQASRWTSTQGGQGPSGRWSRQLSEHWHSGHVHRCRSWWSTEMSTGPASTSKATRVTVQRASMPRSSSYSAVSCMDPLSGPKPVGSRTCPSKPEAGKVRSRLSPNSSSPYPALLLVFPFGQTRRMPRAACIEGAARGTLSYPVESWKD